MASWAEVVAFSQPLTINDELQEEDREVTFRVMGVIPLLVWDPETQRRRILGARWGFPDAKDWRRPQPRHARSETIETTKAFSGAFFDGQRGIALVKTFNEAPDVEGPTIQHTITPDVEKSGIAFLWRKFDIGAPDPLYACVMVTVPANKLIAALPTDRMPAVLDPADWAKWIGEETASLDELKAMLKTVEGVNWRMQKEEASPKPTRPKRPKPPSDPELF